MKLRNLETHETSENFIITICHKANSANGTITTSESNVLLDRKTAFELMKELKAFVV